MIAVQSSARVGTNGRIRKPSIIAEKVFALTCLVGRPEINVRKFTVFIGLLAGMATCAVVGEELLAMLYRVRSVLFVQLRHKLIAVLELARSI